VGKSSIPEKALIAFEILKNTLYSEPEIAYPRSDRKFSLIEVTASGTKEEKGGQGANLCQTNEKRGPLRHFLSKRTHIN
jgi:hypothetical protein